LTFFENSPKKKKKRMRTVFVLIFVVLLCLLFTPVFTAPKLDIVYPPNMWSQVHLGELGKLVILRVSVRLGGLVVEGWPRGVNLFREKVAWLTGIAPATFSRVQRSFSSRAEPAESDEVDEDSVTKYISPEDISAFVFSSADQLLL
jgi:hypothetical protein